MSFIFFIDGEQPDFTDFDSFVMVTRREFITMSEVLNLKAAESSRVHAKLLASRLLDVELPEDSIAASVLAPKIEALLRLARRAGDRMVVWE